MTDTSNPIDELCASLYTRFSACARQTEDGRTIFLDFKGAYTAQAVLGSDGCWTVTIGTNDGKPPLEEKLDEPCPINAKITLAVRMAELVTREIGPNISPTEPQASPQPAGA